jgi:histidinol-phosphate/aromatic aminotransferase/cobyric acid decarboxylase-like protein
MHPFLANCLRLTVGTADENTQMLAALEFAVRSSVSNAPAAPFAS